MNKNTLKTIAGVAMMIIGALCTLSSCNSVVSNKTESIDVRIISSHKNPETWSSDLSGNYPKVVHTPADYRVTVEYAGKMYTLTDEDTYRLFHDRIGDTVKAFAEVTTYDDGAKKYRIISIYDGG